ncbi:MAG: 6-pyruvoyl tetrahydrobiopterin synthase [Ignavibacteriae bacterium]|nr:MAG: 6-pyruvoyl tetrahydrobiopterin synthase [Ignavibacteriota bacterium]
MIYLSRKEYFCASHRLFNEKYDDQKNMEVFGKCSNPAGHGHNYELIVTIVGEPDPETGMIMDLKKLSDIIKREIIDKVDHKNLNVDVDFLKGIIPTTENLAIVFWKILEPKITQGKLYSIKISETEKNMTEFKG